MRSAPRLLYISLSRLKKKKRPKQVDDLSYHLSISPVEPREHKAKQSYTHREKKERKKGIKRNKKKQMQTTKQVTK
ncbi:hypothetical protein C7212DRAFT_319553 [Tuber magnatum]|uniref:Uncharacterized protein n=1 Tax=Tuber magnatum TaxID=42249 RepID=A0A317SQM5_9PEZI|nr:hypothetical protein C7212DRAFT_319553 [Tuber magnatum]